MEQVVADVASLVNGAYLRREGGKQGSPVGWRSISSWAVPGAGGYSPVGHRSLLAFSRLTELRDPNSKFRVFCLCSWPGGGDIPLSSLTLWLRLRGRGLVYSEQTHCSSKLGPVD